MKKPTKFQNRHQKKNSTENVVQDKEEDHEWVWPQNIYVNS